MRERNSNIEILRIIAIIGITFYHIRLWGGYSFESITMNLILLDMFSMFGKIGVNLFAIISGFYLFNTPFRFEKMLKVWLQILLFSIGLGIISFAFSFFNNNIDLSIKELVKSVFPITLENYWYGCAYLLLILFAPFYNKLISVLDNQQYKLFVSMIVFVWCIIPTISFRLENAYGINNYLSFFVMYFIGSYIRVYSPKWKLKYAKVFLLFFVILQISFPAIIALVLPSAYMTRATYIRYANSVSSVAITILIFYLFENRKPKNNVIINRIAKASFSLYLIQEHIVFRSILWRQILKVTFYESSNSFFMIFHLIGGVFVLYLMACLCEFLCGFFITPIVNFLLPLKKVSFVKRLEEI